MYNHVSADYICPICLGVRGIESEQTLIHQSDILYKDDQVMVFVSSFFIGNNPGHLIVVPCDHYENLYDLPEDVGAQIMTTAKMFSVIMRQAYGCEGVTVLQNNEPAGGQHAFHYHMHLFPRYEHDELHAHMNRKHTTTSTERMEFVEKIMRVFATAS